MCTALKLVNPMSEKQGTGNRRVENTLCSILSTLSIDSIGYVLFLLKLSLSLYTLKIKIEVMFTPVH